MCIASDRLYFRFVGQAAPSVIACKLPVGCVGHLPSAISPWDSILEVLGAGKRRENSERKQAA